MITKRTYNKILVPLTVLLLILSISLSRLLYGRGATNPEVFSDIWCNISDLGDMENNPIGFLYFQIWGIVAGAYILHAIPSIHSDLMQFKDLNLMLGNKVLFGGKYKVNHNGKSRIFRNVYWLSQKWS